VGPESGGVYVQGSQLSLWENLQRGLRPEGQMAPVCPAQGSGGQMVPVCPALGSGGQMVPVCPAQGSRAGGQGSADVYEQTSRRPPGNCDTLKN
jgi:hypothetical protein